MPALLQWKDKNDSSVADGFITFTNEVAQNLHLMPQTTGKTTGDNQILRYAQLLTSLVGSNALRAQLTHNQQNGNGSLPSRIDPNHFVQSGSIRERNTDLDK